MTQAVKKMIQHLELEARKTLAARQEQWLENTKTLAFRKELMDLLGQQMQLQTIEAAKNMGFRAEFMELMHLEAIKTVGYRQLRVDYLDHDSLALNNMVLAQAPGDVEQAGVRALPLRHSMVLKRQITAALLLVLALAARLSYTMAQMMISRL